MSDNQDYIEAQHKTITAQCKKINELEKKLEDTEIKLMKAMQNETATSALSKDQSNTESDGERICLIQLALLCGSAMNGELTLEETKKVEIYVKTLQIIKGKAPEKEKYSDSTKKMTTEELMRLVDSELKN